MSTTRLNEIYSDKAEKALEEKKHQDLLAGYVQLSSTVIDTTASLIKYLEGTTSKVKVVNQLEKIGTPDAFKVVAAIQSLHGTLKTHKNTDLTEITGIMKEVLKQAEMIPKEHATSEKQQFVDYTKQLQSLKEAVTSIEKAVKEQKLIAEAPIVNLPETVVNVPEVDLKPLQKNIAKVVTAITKIVIPEYKTDNAEVEKLIKKTNKLLNDILDKPVSSGGGGGGRVSPYSDSAGMPSFVVLESDGSIPVTVVAGGSATPSYATKIDTTTTANVIYIGNAAIASSAASAVWQIKKLDTSTLALDKTWADGNDDFDNVWNNRASLTYS